MRKTQDSEKKIDTESIIDLIETCHSQANTIGILKAASRLIAVAFQAQTVAYTLIRDEGSIDVFISSFQEVGLAAKTLIKSQVSSLLSDVHRRQVAEEQLNPTYIHPDVLREGEIKVPKILWSVDIGPVGQNMGSLAVFGTNRDQMSERALLGLRSIGRVLGAALAQEAPAHAGLYADQTPGIVEFRIDHIQAIREAFGPHRTNRLKVDIAQRIVEALPKGAAVAKIHEDGITAIISDPSIDLTTVQADCLRACRGIEMNERILIKVESFAASSALASDTQVAALNVSTPLSDHPRSAAGDQTH